MSANSRVCGSPQKSPVQVFFLLDDYASWLAQRESRIADLLGLCIEESAEGIRLHLAVVESKYVAAEAAADAYFKEVVDPLLDEQRHESQEELERAQRFAHAFRFICPSEYLPGKQAGAAF